MFRLAMAVLFAVPTVQAQEVLRHRDVRVLDLSGSPHERGLQHGRALHAEVRELLEGFERELERTYGVEADEFRTRFLADTDFMPAIELHAPGLLEEVRGIADGAKVEFERVYLFQLADEIWSMGSWALREKCTAIALDPRGEQPAIVAQNMDIPGFYQKYPLLLRVHSNEGPDQLLFSCPGLIGVNGMNSAAVAVACNTLLQLKPSHSGVPCLFVVRGVLSQTTLSEAEAWLKRIPHAVGQNYTLGDPSGVRAFECSAGAKVRFLPSPSADFTYHTNHPLVNTDWHPDYVQDCRARNVQPAQGLNPCHRFETLGQRVQAGAEMTVHTLRSILASRAHPRGPICGDWTYGCTVFLLHADAPELQLSPGRPDQVAPQAFGFKK